MKNIVQAYTLLPNKLRFAILRSYAIALCMGIIQLYNYVQYKSLT
jgi:hypothetical protein